VRVNLTVFVAQASTVNSRAMMTTFALVGAPVVFSAAAMVVHMWVDGINARECRSLFLLFARLLQQHQRSHSSVHKFGMRSAANVLRANA
jgi:hypothetical protein